jgi:hypothetical protein
MTERTLAGSSMTYRLSPESGAIGRGVDTMHFGNAMSGKVAQYFTRGRVLSYINPHVLHPFVPRDMTVANGQSKFSNPIFMLLVDEPLPANSLADLKEITFD